MGKVKKILHAKVVAYSLIEVIVSTIIILIAILLFSQLLGQLFSSRKIMPETRAMIKLADYYNGVEPDSLLSELPDEQIRVSQELQTFDSFTFRQISFMEKGSKKVLLKYYQYPVSDTACSLFQK